MGLLVFGLALAVYQPAWNGGALWDDAAYITAPSLRSVDSLVHIWISPGTTEQYYPLVHTVFWVEHRLWGDATTGYHLANILLHALSACLLAGILQELAIPGAWLAAMIFAVHPVEVESVAWIAELKNTLSGAFYLAAALAYLRFDRSRQRKFYVAALVLFVLGLMSKTAIVTLPAALLVVFWWKRGALNWRRDFLPLIPFWIAGMAGGILTEWMERKMVGAEGSEFSFSLVERMLIAGRDFWFYLDKLACPVNLTFIYPRWHIDSTVAWQYAFPAAALLLTALLVWRRWRGPLAALLFFGGTLFPALGFVNVYAFRYSFVADHFQYLASLGPIVLASAGVAMGLARLPATLEYLRPAAAALLLAALGTLTWQQCHMYGNIETLWRTTIARNPECWLAYNDLGAFYYDHGRTAEAIPLYRKSLSLKPDNAEGHNNLGAALDKLGQTDAAIGEYEKAVEFRPGFAEAQRNLGDALQRQGKLDQAVAHFEESVALRPDLPRAHENLAGAYAQKGNIAGAVEQHRAYLKITPKDIATHYNLGVLLLQNARREEAIAEFEAVLALQPDNAEARNNLGYALLQKGQPDAAIAQFQKALAVNTNYAQASFNLANALLQKDDTDAAIALLGKLAADHPNVAEIHVSLGNAFLKKADKDDANREYELAASLRQKQARSKP
jgi:tetratricopeptide (TPR) repeat protein